jgi:uroporphyrinogen III methyltransferase/synthase
MSQNENRTGTVYLVGAGPGAPDLITVRGAQLLVECDAVVYDNLVPDELITLLPSSVERIYVGKKASAHSLPQEEINQLLVDLASRGKRVVRLKGGDPFVFGRGGEEAEFLAEQKIPFEVVPGVTAGIAGPACAGIPVTDRRYASSLTLMTGHKAATSEADEESWSWLGQAKDNTIVIYMGVAELEQNVKRLLDAGKSPDTPAAAIERGATPTQRVITAPLVELPERVREAGLQPPALFVIGDVVSLRDKIDWYQQRPLSGLRVMVCRPADQAVWVYQRLRDLGAEVLAYPTIATEEDVDQSGWQRVIGLDVLDRWLVFTSENGVRYFLKQWREQVGDVRGLADYRIAAVGYGTARALETFTLKADFVPTVATTADLASQMATTLELDGATVVRVRGNLGDDRVEQTLTKAGASVISLTVYQTMTAQWSDVMKDKLLTNPPDVIMLTSGSTVDGLAANLNEDELRGLTEGAFIVSIGPMTSEVIRGQGMTVGLEARTFSIPAMIDELVAHHQTKPIRRTR